MASIRKNRLDADLAGNGFGGTDYRAFLRKNWLWLLTIGSLLVVLVILLSIVVDSRQRVMAMEVQHQLSLASPASPAPEATGNPVTGEEFPVTSGQFPGTVTGPAIVQWWDGGSACGLFRLAEGETFTYDGLGTWWQFPSETGAVERYPAHRAEYFNSNQGCHEGKPEG